MKLPYRNRLEPLANMAGLGMWAGSQMLLVVTLAGALSLDLVGVFSLGLAVFSLAMVALGLNLRLAIAVDREDRIGVLPALAIRLATALAVYAAALVVMRIYAPRWDLFLLAALLLAGRIADQLVDVFYGYQQQHGRGVHMSASFFARGLMTCIFCLCLFVWRERAFGVVLVGTFAYCAGSLLLEVAWFRGSWRSAQPIGRGMGAVLENEHVRSFSTFPMFDALHFSSFRLAVAPVLDTRSFGLFALAMNAFSAAQVVITALGLTSLTRLRSGVHDHAADPVRAMLRESGLYGGVCLAFFALCSLAFALLGGLKVTDPAALDLFLAGNFAALMPFCFTGFIAQGAIFFGNRAGYWQAPLAGSLAFGGAAAALVALARLLHWPLTMAYLALCAALLLSCLIRLAVSAHHLGTLRAANG